MKNTLIIGASSNPERYSYKAMKMLLEHKHPVQAIGSKEEQIFGYPIHKAHVPFKDIDTVTLYINPHIQEDYYDYIISLRPKRVIFNPGTENQIFQKKLDLQQISWIEACTLVLLSTGQYE